jgi:integrase
MTARPARAWVRENNRSKQENRSHGKKRWEVVYVDPQTRKRRTKGGFTNKGDAQAWADEFLTKSRRNEWIDPSRATATLSEVALQWFASQHFDRQRTADGYWKIITGNNDLTRTFGETPIGDITPDAVGRWIKDMAAELAPQTVRHRFYALRMVLDYAVENEMLLVNPARRVNVRRLPKPTRMAEHERKRHRITPEEVDKVIAAMPEPHDMFTLLVAGTGMRPEEACGLTLGDVDTIEQTVAVRAVVVEVNGKLVREEVTKTPKSRRTIDLDPVVGDALLAYVELHRKRATVWFSEHPEHVHPGDELPLFVGLVVGGETGLPDVERLDYSKPMRYSAFNKRHWRKARKTAGLPDAVRFYDLRHFHASQLLDAGGLTLKEVQERLGHSSAVMTMDRYWHMDNDAEARKRRRAAVAAAMGRKEAPANVTQLNSKRSS